MTIVMLTLRLNLLVTTNLFKVTKDNRTSIKHSSANKSLSWTQLKKMMSYSIVKQKEANDVDVKTSIMRR